jgi:hypothetical protein
MPKKYNVDELIALQQEILGLLARFDEYPYDPAGRLIMLRGIEEFDLRDPQKPRVIKNLALTMPEVRDVLKELAAKKGISL